MAGSPDDIDLLTDDGTQIAPLNYPHLGHTEIFNSVEDFYKKFYFRPSKIASIVGEMLTSPRHDEAPPARGRGILPVPAQPRRSVSTPVHAGGLSWLDACRGGPIKIG